MSSFGVEEENETHEESVRITGRVKWFDAGKGYGFIVPDDASLTGLKDVLLHVTSLRQSGRENALEGSLITCDAIRRPKGWQVSEIVELDESTAQPAERPHRPFDREGPRRDYDSQPRGGGFRDRPAGDRRNRQARPSGPRSSGSTAPRVTASSSAKASRATSSCTSRPCAAAESRTCSRARASWSASPPAGRVWSAPRSRRTSADPAAGQAAAFR